MREKMVMDARRGYEEPEPAAPFLDMSGERERVVIPSPKKSDKLIVRMHAYKFTFRAANGKHCARWVRFTDQAWNGKLWSGTHWLELARKCHDEAYLFTEA